MEQIKTRLNTFRFLSSVENYCMQAVYKNQIRTSLWSTNYIDVVIRMCNSKESRIRFV